MIINNEYYVSPEVAKLLKKAGFDWEVNKVYELNQKNKELFGEIASWQGKAFREDVLPIVTFDVAQRWLREKNLLLYIPPCHIDGKWLWRYWITNCINKEDTTQIYSVKKYNTYEEAQEAGIKKALKIVLEKGE